MEQRFIRNFCIIAHIDHGKSTLADRLLELTGTVSEREMADQFLDQMDLERERGITIKAQAVRMMYRGPDDQAYEFNLIDTPGHVDFTYEVSRSLAACEGALLVVDASQGVEAQTIANAYLALEQGLTMIPLLNKLDLPNANPPKVAKEIETALPISQGEILNISAKEGWGTKEVLQAIVERIPSPSGNPQSPLKALIFDSIYDPYKGVIAYVRVVDGRVSLGERILLMSSGREAEALEIGIFTPGLRSIKDLVAGEVGYIATGLKNVRDCQVGDTITLAHHRTSKPLPGYRPIKPMVFAGLYPVENKDYSLLRNALDKLHLNDASLVYEQESSEALGFGFRCGFLGTLHMEIVQERLEREYGVQLLATNPNVEYRVNMKDGSQIAIENPAHLPSPVDVQSIEEPWMTITILTPHRYIGPIMELVTGRRGAFIKMEYLEGGQVESPTGERRVVLTYAIPLSEILIDFYDQLKSCSQGFASLDYAFLEYRPASLVRLEILVNNQPVDALSLIVHQEKAYREGKAVVERLRAIIPRQLFDVTIQAAIGSRVIARDTVKALRKNVLAKCYGGDVTRKRKLLEKQAEGKKRMKRVGQVEIPPEAFVALLRLK